MTIFMFPSARPTNYSCVGYSFSVGLPVPPSAVQDIFSPVGSVFVLVLDKNSTFSNMLIEKDKAIEGNVKCRHLKTLTCKGPCGRCLSVWCSEPHTPPPPSHGIRVYSLLIHTGGEGRVEPERRLERQQFTKLGRKYQLYLLISPKPW